MREFLSPVEIIFRKYFPKRMDGYKNIQVQFKSKNGIEIGGPTYSFGSRGFLPIYKVIKSPDNVNFSSNTIWEGDLTEGQHFKFGNKIGKQYIKEANNLNGIIDSKYDFLISSHNIEHLANPLNTIQEWKRVVKPGGYFLFILPNKEGTFDHKRPVTTIDHLINDLNKKTTEDDQTHFEEVLALHDLSIDPGGLNYEDFKQRTLKNIENRCVHHHVFDLDLLEKIALVSNIQIIQIEKFSKIHLVLLGKNNK